MEIFQPDSLTPYLPQLCHLLTDCVEDGASIGFLWPMTEQEASHYWQEMQRQRDLGQRLCWLAVANNRVVGTVQLALPDKPNARHRGEVEKLMVHPNQRQQGIARTLMALLQSAALVQKRTLLVLDTRLGDPASDLYRKLGFIQAGQIPGYALNHQGTADTTVYFYKHL